MINNTSIPFQSTFFNASRPLTQFKLATKDILINHKCPLCKGILMYPYKDICGHLYCKACIEKSLTLWRYCPINKTHRFIEEDNKLSLDKVAYDFVEKVIEEYESDDIIKKDNKKSNQYK